MGSEYSHTSMLEFCRYLHQDIEQNTDERVSFADYIDVDKQEKKELLNQRLMRLKELIAEKEELFGEGHCFL